MGPQSLLELPVVARSGSVPLVRTSSPALWSSLSASEIEARATELAAAFHEYGLERGRRVAILADAGPDATVVSLAAVRAGGIALVIDPGVSRDKLAAILVERAVVQAVAGDEAQLRRLLEIRADLPDLELVLVARVELSDRPTPALTLDAACVAGAQILERDGKRLESQVGVPVIETVGPEGAGSSWSDADLLRAAERIATELNLDSSDTVLARLRADHADQLPLVVACLSRGATLVFSDPKERLSFVSMGQSHATIAAVAPSDLDTLCHSIAEAASSKTWIGRRLHAWALHRGRNRATHPRAHRIAEQLVLRGLREPAGQQLRLIQAFGVGPDVHSMAILDAIGFKVQGPKMTES